VRIGEMIRGVRLPEDMWLLEDAGRKYQVPRMWPQDHLEYLARAWLTNGRRRIWFHPLLIVQGTRLGPHALRERVLHHVAIFQAAIESHKALWADLGGSLDWRRE